VHLFSKYCRLGLTIGIFLLSGYSFAETDAIKTESVSPKEASVMHVEQKAVIVDVREDKEWNEHHIPGAVHIPLPQLNERLSELKQYKDSPVITQCRGGKRSAEAQIALKSAGFSKVYNMDGGIQAWDKEGLATE
jgi:rhodanese-related sulfurtransferase